MSYQALYRKWRPDNFEDVKGQDHIVTTLKNQINADRIGHAYLFCGTRGTGKTSVAKIFAKAVNCEHPVNGSPCGECPTCKAIAAGTSMNVIEIDAASNNGVDNIREIRDEVQYSPTEGKYKVYIIDEVHMLSTGAFNALLKTLEEPPSYVIFILATTEVAKIPVTIMSRCQRYDFHRISIETIADRLSELMKAENIVVEDKAIRYVAKAADGSMRDALSLLDQCIAFHLGEELKYDDVLDVLGAVDIAIFSNMYKTIRENDVARCMNLMEDIIMQGRDLSQFVTDFIWYLRNLLLIKTTRDTDKIEDVIEVSKDNIADMMEDAKEADVDTLMRHIRVLSELSNDMKTSTQKRVKAEVTFIKLMRPSMEKPADMTELTGRINTLETQLGDAMQVIEKLKSGELIPAGMLNAMGQGTFAGANGAGVSGSEAETSDTKPVIKRNYDAVTDDIRQIASQWNNIISSIDDALLMNFLKQAYVTVTEDGNSLEIMIKSLSGYNAISREETVTMLEEHIEERTGISVRIVVTKMDEEEDFNKRYVALEELVGMNIEVDDKEEFI
ncbi:dNA polymerase [Eubacterium sp. CAG:252]|jgi:DNA polymerase-3 subunit gamma/tau|uniref:DNA polymerase III subunit gamma/tau n=1 Tax=Lachnospira sp. TaxID=2049031 RepID=UPI000335E5EE|nr:dNA polymerase [Eubacterium sp. CAG:252]